MVDIFKALSDENRLRIINILREHELCVCEIEIILDLSQSNVSRHLKNLKQIGIVEASKDAQWVHYSLSPLFLNEHSDLLVYLDKHFELGVYSNDLGVLNKYRANGLNCTDVKERKDQVVELIF